MKKIKMLAVAAGLLLVTAGVFAGKSKFSVSNIYFLSGGTTGTYEELISTSVTDFTTSGNHQAELVGSESTPVTYPLYTYNGTSYVAIYTTF
jgi:hypothetical protein